MKPGRARAALILLFTLLLTFLSGGVAEAAIRRPFTTGRKLIFDPQDPAATAFEQHENGYVVSLSSGAKELTMNIFAVPDGEGVRAAEKAKLILCTGVTLKPGAVYRVRFTLSAELAQQEYAISLDSGGDQGVFGFLEGRGIPAGGTDRVDVRISAGENSGELILRLLLGKTGAEGNTFRLSELAVDEVSDDESGNQDAAGNARRDGALPEPPDAGRFSSAIWQDAGAGTPEAADVRNVEPAREGDGFVRTRKLPGFQAEYHADSNTLDLPAPLSPEAQERGRSYGIFFLPVVEGEEQPYLGDPMPYYEDGVFYIYYLKDGGDSFNHSVYLVTTRDFVSWTEQDEPVLVSSGEDLQDNWIGTGTVIRVDGIYYFIYTGHNSTGSREYNETILLARGSSPFSFEKVSGWEIRPPDSLKQKADFRDPNAVYDPDTGTITLTITASQDGAARILKYTLDRNLENPVYDGIIFTDPTRRFWNLECSDTFRMGNTWYLTYSAQDDTLWYARADSSYGPYRDATRLDGKLFYAAKHVEDGQNFYMAGWARRSHSAGSLDEISAWAGNLVVQKLKQSVDGSLALVPVDSICSAFRSEGKLSAEQVTLSAGSGYRFHELFTAAERFLLKGEFCFTGEGTFGLAFDFDGSPEQYKLITLDPMEGCVRLAFRNGATVITESSVFLSPAVTHTFTLLQEGSAGVFYVDDQASLTVRLYGITGRPVRLFAENCEVTFRSLKLYTRDLV